MPLASQLDKRALLPSQKYNPTRTVTYAGTLGLAGVQCAIYPVQSPGGYQILGRTLSPWDAVGRFEGEGIEKHFLVRSFDIIKWQHMSEEEFLKVSRHSHAVPREKQSDRLSHSKREKKKTD